MEMSVLLTRRSKRKRIFLSFVRNSMLSFVRVDSSIPSILGKRTSVPTENPPEIIPIKNRSLSKLSLCKQENIYPQRKTGRKVTAIMTRRERMDILFFSNYLIISKTKSSCLLFSSLKHEISSKNINPKNDKKESNKICDYFWGSNNKKTKKKKKTTNKLHRYIIME